MKKFACFDDLELHFMIIPKSKSDILRHFSNPNKLFSFISSMSSILFLSHRSKLYT